MSPAAGALNLAMGLVYLNIGVLTLADLRREREARGVSPFGIGIVLLAATCGPHHAHHGLHLLAGVRDAGVLDLVTVGVGLVPGGLWYVLRLEARSGRAGDRFVAGSPLWMEALPTIGGAYVVAVVGAGLGWVPGGVHLDWNVVPNVALVGLYVAIGATLLRTQVLNRAALGGWSLSGLSLAGLFLTCALMHLVHAAYIVGGAYDADWHGRLVDTASVPAGAFFLWVVWSIQTRRIADWDRSAPRRADLDEAPVEWNALVGGPIGSPVQ